MSIADIIIITMVAFMALIGLWKGFFKTLITFCGWFISMLFAVLTAGVIAEALLDVESIGNFVAGGDGMSIFSFFYGMLPSQIKSLPVRASASDIESAIGVGAVGAIIRPFLDVLTKGPIINSSATVGEGIALLLAGGVFEVLVGIAMFIVVRIIMTLLVLFLKSLVSENATGALGRLGGFLLGAVRGGLYCAVLLLIVGFLTPFTFMEPVTAEIDNGILARPVAEQVYTLSAKMTANDNYFNKLLKLRGKGGQLSANEKAIVDFSDSAMDDLFSGTLKNGTRTRYDSGVDALKNKLSAASATLKKGIKDKDAEKREVAELVGEGGDLYKAFKLFRQDLNDYLLCDESALSEKQAEVDVDLANIAYLINNTAFKTLFGDLTITGLEVEPNLDKLNGVE